VTFAVPASLSDLPENRFQFTFPGVEDEFSIPMIQFIPFDVLDGAGSDELELRGLAVALGDTALGDQLAKLNALQLDALGTAWQTASVKRGKGLGLGESPASTD
jgi:hypothetical protein